MKRKVSKGLKIVLISILAIMTLASSFFLYKEIMNPIIMEEKVPVYSYTNKSSINYQVLLRPNKLYDSNSIGEGQLYITEYVDYIKADLKYSFEGETSAKVNGDYSIIARVTGYKGDGDDKVTIWERDFPIIKNKAFNSEGDSFLIDEKIDIGLDEYNDFAEEIIESSKISSQSSLHIIMDVNLRAETDKGPIEKTTSSNLIIPLNVSMFEIGGDSRIENEGAIEEIVDVRKPINKTKAILFGLTIGISSLAIIYLIFFTITVNKDPLEKQLNKIFKKHGDRLVALNSDLEYPEASLSRVKSIEDLVKMADEVEQPILYKYSGDYREINKFYITHGNKLYLLDLSGLDPIAGERGDMDDQGLVENE